MLGMKRGKYLLLMLILLLHSLAVQCQGKPVVQRAVDIVLPCEYVLMKEGGRGSLGGLTFSRERVTLVLRNISVTGEGEELDPITEYEAPKDKENTTYQATVRVGPLPFAERLLHAECEGEEVGCEISPIYGEFYVAHVYLPELSVSMMCQAEVSMEEQDVLKEQGEKTVTPMTVDYIVSSSPPSHHSHISGDVSLNCEVWGDLDRMEVEWYFQSEGRGRRVFPSEEPRVSVGQEGQKSKGDEGTYICTVSAEQHKIQQILKLGIREPPRVSISQRGGRETRLTCRTDRYYPLDVEFDWLLNGSPVPDPDIETSSHRKNSDGTYNLSSTLTVPLPAAGSDPHTYTCSVSHVSLAEPILAHVSIALPDAESYTPSGYRLIVSSTIISAIIFIVALAKSIWAKQKQGAEKKKE
uniref:TAP binding protein like n=1 Tax=Xenopus tropicalis TaxID=8364 RepID=A0A7D9NMD7_XENTR